MVLMGLIQWMQRQNPHLENWLNQAERIHARWITISQVAFCPKPAVEGDVLLAGDSAGLIPPLAGNGISMALCGGCMAADALTTFLSGISPAAQVRAEYATAWKKRFGSRLRLGSLLQPLLFCPPAAALAIPIFNHLPGIGRYLMNQTREPPRESPGDLDSQGEQITL